jgi:hypothetical protein
MNLDLDVVPLRWKRWGEMNQSRNPGVRARAKAESTRLMIDASVDGRLSDFREYFSWIGACTRYALQTPERAVHLRTARRASRRPRRAARRPAAKAGADSPPEPPSRRPGALPASRGGAS